MKEGEGQMQEETKDIVLTITLKNGTKYPEVEGPLHNEPLCFYLLKYAELSIIQTNNAPRIEKAKGDIMSFVRKRFHG